MTTNQPARLSATSCLDGILRDSLRSARQTVLARAADLADFLATIERSLDGSRERQTTAEILLRAVNTGSIATRTHAEFLANDADPTILEALALAEAAGQS